MMKNSIKMKGEETMENLNKMKGEKAMENLNKMKGKEAMIKNLKKKKDVNSCILGGWAAWDYWKWLWALRLAGVLPVPGVLLDL